MVAQYQRDGQVGPPPGACPLGWALGFGRVFFEAKNRGDGIFYGFFYGFCLMDSLFSLMGFLDFSIDGLWTFCGFLLF